ncbi:Ribosome maturation factor rimM [Actinomyces bovis]|uniref:Ribosome maturation factor RimM n=1 Tax=Actinomyces bovis TaxID=1658 RepID=A0ABY1VKW6_9ACTO|nr:ribosome maturation factor RimM [Actinomyces bovis]SPT52655.1 Ribosome maturation factor rimM [Actinomyces bovis]VEG54554.1 Ribosome maturation factor rimM [Actinomyces israelii]
MLLTVAVIGPAHALKGEIRLEIRTDDPAGRLAPGSVLPVQAPKGQSAPKQLTVARLRHDGARWFATFVEATDRTAAEALRGLRLLVETDEDDPTDPDDDAWYAHELTGLKAHLLSTDAAGQPTPGTLLGEVTGLEPGVAQDRLLVRTPAGETVAVPFVEALVPLIDPEAGWVLLDPPGGLFPRLGDPEEVRP